MQILSARGGADLAGEGRIAVFEQLFRHSFDPMLVLTAEGQVIAANEAAVSILGLTATEISQSTLTHFLQMAHFLHLCRNARAKKRVQ